MAVNKLALHGQVTVSPVYVRSTDRSKYIASFRAIRCNTQTLNNTKLIFLRAATVLYGNIVNPNSVNV